jgi:ribonuclease E
VDEDAGREPRRDRDAADAIAAEIHESGAGAKRPEPEPVPAERPAQRSEPEPTPAEDPSKPKRGGWWQRRGFF